MTATAPAKSITPAAQMALDKQTISAQLAAGDYAGAWKTAAMAPSYNQGGYQLTSSMGKNGVMQPAVTTSNGTNLSSTELGWLSSPAILNTMTGGALSPQQTSAFYTAAVPYSNQIATSPIFSGTDAKGNLIVDTSHAYTAAGDAGSSGAQIAQKLTSLAANPSQYGTSGPNVSRIGGGTADTGFAKFFDVAVPVAIAAGGAAVTGGAASAALGAGLGSSIAAGALAGSTGSALTSGINGTPVTLGSVGKGALTGGVTGGLSSLASPITNSLAGYVGTPVASGIVKGAVGAGVGALGGALSGGNVGNAALTGGISGAASGLVGGATGSNALGSASGTIAGNLAGKYLTSPSTPAAPAKTVTPAPAASAPLAALPTQAGFTSPDNSAPPTNIGSYSGYGYAPRQQVANPVSNYATYGQGPEAQFFQPTGAAAAPAPYQTQTSTTPATGYYSPTYNFSGPPPMSNIQQGTITRANST